MKEAKTWLERVKYWATVVGMVVAGAVAGYVIGVMVAEDPLSYYSFEITE